MGNEGIQLRVSDLFYAVAKHRMIIALLTAVGILVGVVSSGVSYLRGDVSRNFQITSSIAVNSKVESGEFSSSSTYPNHNDYYLAEDLTTAAMYILKSERTLTEALQASGLGAISREDVANNLSMSQYEDTLIIEQNLYWSNAAEGIAILNAINNVGTAVLQETMNVGGVQVINSPNARRIVGGGFNAVLCVFLGLMGFAVGTGFAVLELLLRPTVLNSGDLNEVYGLEILGEVPHNSGYFEQSGSMLARSRSSLDIAESFAGAAQIYRNLPGGTNQCIYVTSATKGEGKTMTVANLAIHLADMEKRVLMIDFDLQNPQLGSLFLEKVRYENSINALYRGDIDEEEAIVPLTGYLSLLSAVGERNALTLDSNLIDLVGRLRSRYDYILMDVPSVGLSSTMLNLNAVATGAVVVVRYDAATTKEIQTMLEKLDRSGIQVLGCIVNGVKGANISRSRKTVQYTQRKNDSSRPARPEGIIAEDEGEQEEVRTNTALSEETIRESENGADSAGYASMLHRMYDKDVLEDYTSLDLTGLGMEGDVPAAPEKTDFTPEERPVEPDTEEKDGESQV